MTVFDTHTSVSSLGDGVYEARLERDWWIIGGPNGGYLAAVVLRALVAEVNDAERAPRSLTIHYLSRPAEGPARMQVRIEREGRSVSSATLRMVQGDKLIALAMGVFGTAREGSAFSDEVAPELPPPEDCVSVSGAMGNAVPMHKQYDARLSPHRLPFSGGDEAITEGWIRLSEARAVDAPLLAAMTDALPPAVFNRTLEHAPTAGVPTLDLTIHFRRGVPESTADDAYCKFRFTTRHAHDGYIEEDGQLWSADGVLLAHSRQLALIG